jgi:hypothetical protein
MVATFKKEYLALKRRDVANADKFAALKVRLDAIGELITNTSTENYSAAIDSCIARQYAEWETDFSNARTERSEIEADTLLLAQRYNRSQSDWDSPTVKKKVIDDIIAHLTTGASDIDNKLKCASTGRGKKHTVKKSPHYANEERDKLILELRLAKKSFRYVCDYINPRYTDGILDEKAAVAALGRYCKRLNIPYPYGPRGRKADG